MSGTIKLRRKLQDGSFVIECDLGEGTGWEVSGLPDTGIPAWRTPETCDIQIESAAEQLRAAGKDVSIEQPI